MNCHEQYEAGGSHLYLNLLRAVMYLGYEDCVCPRTRIFLALCFIQYQVHLTFTQAHLCLTFFSGPVNNHLQNFSHLSSLSLTQLLS